MNRTITYNPDTHVLVPKEPAESMVHAAEDLPPPRMFGAVYRAMLAAAPEPVQAVGQQDGAVTARMAAAGKKAWHDHYWPNLGMTEHTWEGWSSALAVKVFKAMDAARDKASPAVDAPSVRDAALEEAVIACEAVHDECNEVDSGKWPELRADAADGALKCAHAIRVLKADKGASNG